LRRFGAYRAFAEGGEPYMLKLQIKLHDLYSSLRDREEGQTLTEYALILSLVSIGSIAALTALSGGINGVLDTITTTL
jgi:Flp pilus assembly pilin Flp